MHLDPAKTVITKLGGPAAVAGITKRNLSRVYRWMYPAERGGTGGCIPQSEAQKLLEHARSSGLDLSAEDFFPQPAPQTQQGEVA
ncbi:hypothetical protein V5F41_22495 [Xanthobacter autotrophicus]|uniref:hypothetical protein n=1 Tax=Xanthobacter autotrophicus TaxID=280 RepID=UPI003726C442